MDIPLRSLPCLAGPARLAQAKEGFMARRRAGLLLLAALVIQVVPVTWARAGDCGDCATCASCVITHPCPPPFIHFFENPPCIKYKHACPRPVCDPCNLPHYGYYQTCWQPWPFPPD